MERKVNIEEDDMIIINVGISGIGLAAVDLATSVFRAQVILFIKLSIIVIEKLFFKILFY